MATNPFALDATQRDSVLKQAQDLASKSGKSWEEELWNYGVANGIDAAGIDTYMGFAPGTSQNWAVQNGKIAAPQGNYNPGQAVKPATTVKTANTSQNAASSIQPLGADQRESVLTEARNRASASGKSWEEELWNYAQANGIDAAGIDSYMAFAPGSAQNWAVQNGKVAAQTQTQTPTTTPPAPGVASPPTPAQQNSMPGADGGSQQVVRPKGIVESALSSALPTPGAAQWSVSPDMTVQSQLRSVMDTNNPLMQQARTQGLQIANERGLLNSSIAESGAMDSMYKMALPIAAADASMYARAASENASNATNITNSNTGAATSIANTAANNATSTFNNAANNDTSRFNNAANNATTLAVNNSNNETSRANTAANNATTLATNAANNETSRANAKLQTDAAEALGIEESKYRKLAQGSSSAAQLMTNYQGQLSSLLKDQSFSDTEARQTAIDQLTNSTKAAIQMIGAMAGDSDIAAYMSQLFPAEEGKLAPASPVKW